MASRSTRCHTSKSPPRTSVKGESHHILRKIPVPSFSRDPKETLTIDYKDAAGATGTLSFDLTASQAAQVRDDIATKKGSHSGQCRSAVE